MKFADTNTSPKFDNDEEKIRIDVDFENISGDITRDELNLLLQPNKVKIRLEYVPKKLIWIINSDYEVLWGGYLPIPRGLRLTPRSEYIDLSPYQIHINDDHMISIDIDKAISKYYVINGIEIKLPSPNKPSSWKQKPFSLQIHFESESSIGNSKIQFNTLSNGVTHQAPFRYETIIFGAVGTVKVVGAYPWVSELVLDENNTITKENRYILRPLGKYARYKAAFGTQGWQYANENSDDEMYEISGLEWKLSELLASSKALNKEELSNNDEIQILRDKISEKLINYSNKFKKSRNWPRTSRRLPDVPTTFKTMKVKNNNFAFAKIDGHMLEYLEIEFIQNTRDESCYQSDKFALYFVDKKLIDYEKSTHICHLTNDDRINVGAKWNDEDELVFYQEMCERCSQPRSDTVPDKKKVEEIKSTAANIRSIFLPKDTYMLR